MKDKDFDFDRVGKRLPYRVDEEALQRVTRNVLDETCRQEKISRKLGVRRNYFFYMLGSVAAILLLLVYIGVGHKKEVQDRLKMAEVSAGDSLREFYSVSDRRRRLRLPLLFLVLQISLSYTNQPFTWQLQLFKFSLSTDSCSDYSRHDKPNIKHCVLQGIKLCFRE